MRMDLAHYVIKAVLVEGQGANDVCAAHGISRSWLYELVGRYRELGDDGLEPRSRRPRSSPARLAVGTEDEIVALRKELTSLGVDAAPTRSTTTCSDVIATDVKRCRRWLRPGGPSPVGASSSPSRRSGRRAPGGGPKPSSPTSAGRPTPPTGPSPMAPMSRSSTSSTTTPG